MTVNEIKLTKKHYFKLKIKILGSSGFVGKELSKFLSKNYVVQTHNKKDLIIFHEDCIINLIGKAHDLKNISDIDSYYKINYELSNIIFDKFLESSASIFITISSVKAAADILNFELTEDHIPNPVTHYGKSKLLAEQYILSKQIPIGKRVFILRPCMIHGPGNKGNLNLLYKIVSKGLPWPLGAYENKRSFCSIGNLCFVINELIENDQIPSGLYNISDDNPLSTNELIKLISQSQGKQSFIWHTPKLIINTFSKLGDLLRLPLNTERLNKLTENYIVSNIKIKQAINKPLPISSKDGLIKTFNSFNNA